MDKQLQLWDLGSGEVVCDYHWPSENPVMLYAAKFSKHVRDRILHAASASRPLPLIAREPHDDLLPGPRPSHCRWR